MDNYALIKQVKAHPVIWNQKHKSHRNRFQLEKSWNVIAKEMNSPSDSVRQRWKSLRDTFRKELKKIADGQDNEEDEDDSSITWNYFQAMLFLRGQFQLNKPDEQNDQAAINDEYNESKVMFMEECDIGNDSQESGTPTEMLTSSRKRPATDLDDDVGESFFNSLRPHMRQLPLNKRMLLQIKVQQLVYDFIYKENSDWVDVKFSEN